MAFTFDEQVLDLLEASLQDALKLFISFIIIGELIQASEFVPAIFMDGFACQVVFYFGLGVVDHV
jgi:hypothetical protein